MSFSRYLPAYRDLFVGRCDDYAMQLTSGHYRRVGKPLTTHDLVDHLLGVRSYGTYVTNATGHCRFAVFDADTSDGLSRLWSLQDELARANIASYVEHSRRGGHLWVFLEHPVPASQVRAWLSPWCPKDWEFYPKQDEGKGYGSLIRLPLGVHRKSGQRYHFVERTATGVVSLTATEAERVAWLSSITRMEVPPLCNVPARSGVQPLPPRSSLPANNGTAPVSPIRQWNAAQDPLQVIGRYVELDSNGVGQCPFGTHHTGGSDQQPSFKVYAPGVAGGYCWYCYTWQQGGSVFDFLRHYYALDAKTLWERIQADNVI